MQATSPEAGEDATYLWFHLFLVTASVINSCCELQLMTIRVQSVDWQTCLSRV